MARTAEAMERLEPIERPGAWGGLAAGLALVAAVRAIYLLRFGGDPCPMNFNFLLEAKAVRFGYPVEYNGMPLVPALLLVGRSAGLGSAAALGAIYAAAHLLLALGLFRLSTLVLRQDGRTRAALAVTVAVLPLFATDAGYQNLSCTAAAGLLAALAAVVLTPAPAGGAGRVLALGGTFLLAAAGSSARSEGALAVAALGLALAAFGPRLAPRPATGRAGGFAALGGLVASLALSLAWERRTGGAGRAALYAFYSFYVASPLVLRLRALLHDPASVATEYGRYLQAVRAFGSFGENGGSVVTALARHPGQAAAWLALKPIDLAASVLAPDSFTPAVLAPLALAARRARREGSRRALARWTPLLAAFGAPLLFLLAAAPGHSQYALVFSPLVLLVALWGVEEPLGRATPTGARRLGWAVALCGALAVAVVGRTSPSSTPALDAAARWLERRCAAGGCLVNALPQPVDGQAWADLQAGAPLPHKVKRDEAFVLRRYPPSYLEGVRLERRVALARASGWVGPVLYVRFSVKSVEPFSPEFDPEHALEGEPDLSTAVPVATFRDGPDLVEIFELRT